LNDVLLHLGSNKGNRSINLKFAQLLINQSIGLVHKESMLYVTSPWGKEDQEDFYNMAVMVTSALDAEQILSKIHIIEDKLGRVRLEKWGPRVIDIDIIFVGQQIIKKPHLKIPHPELSNRNFVLVPLMDLCPSFLHPILKKTIKEIYSDCTDTGIVKLYRDRE
jgi:2-amino-4-hydroxy-6-hydroxymethyldihydropteridine diphosphokinase